MSNFTEALNKFVCMIDKDTMLGHEVIEITVGNSLFLNLMTDLQLQYNQGDLFKGYKELPEYVKLFTPSGYVKINHKKGSCE